MISCKIRFPDIAHNNYACMITRARSRTRFCQSSLIVTITAEKDGQTQYGAS